jgi:hypothetical protein
LMSSVGSENAREVDNNVRFPPFSLYKQN